MKAGKVIIGCIIFGALLSIAIMIKYAMEIKVEDQYRTREDPAKAMYQFTRQMGVISLNQNSSLTTSQRFPYVAAITKNYSFTWSFACFASVILVKWVVTSAHCRQVGATHRVLLYHDFVRNYTQTYPILFWILHDNYESGSPGKNDIAVAKLNLDEVLPSSMKSSYIDEGPSEHIVASIWKTVSTMDKRLFLTNDLESFDMKLAPDKKCHEIYGVTLDSSLFCVDMGAHTEDCFVNEFGPIYSSDKIVGIIALKPRECDVKFAVFTNVSYYTKWILQTTKTTIFG